MYYNIIKYNKDDDSIIIEDITDINIINDNSYYENEDDLLYLIDDYFNSNSNINKILLIACNNKNDINNLIYIITKYYTDENLINTFDEVFIILDSFYNRFSIIELKSIYNILIKYNVKASLKILCGFDTEKVNSSDIFKDVDNNNYYLNQLIVKNEDITKANYEVLFKSLQFIDTLTLTIDFSKYKVSYNNYQIELIALFNFLNKSKTIKALNLKGVFNCCIFNKDNLYINTFKSISMLNKLFKRLCRFIENNNTLTILYLVECGFNNIGILDNYNKYIKFDNVQLFFNSLCKNNSITTLNLTDIHDDYYSFYKYNERIELYNKQFREEFSKQLQKLLLQSSNITELTVSFVCKNYSLNIGKVLSKNNTLTYLDIEGDLNLINDIIVSLKSNSSLNFLNLSYYNNDLYLKSQKHVNLIDAHYNFNGCNEEIFDDFPNIIDILQYNLSLVSLNLDYYIVNSSFV